jgi:two-component system NarL family sensor kinase
MSGSQRSLAPALVAGVATVMLVCALAIGLPMIGWEEALSSYMVNAGITGLALALIGALVMREDRGNAVGVLLAAAGLWATLGSLCIALAAVVESGSPVQWVLVFVESVWMPTMYLFLLVPQLYPHGTVMSPKWRIPFLVSVGAAIASTLALVLSDHVFDEYPGLTNPLALSIPDAVIIAISVAGALTLFVISVAAVVGQARRMRIVTGAERSRIAWLVTAILLMVLAMLGPTPAVALMMELASIACLGIGIVRHQLFNIETVLSRSLVYAIVIAAALLAALGVAAALGSVTEVGVWPALAAAVTSLILATAFGRLRHLVDRLLFGRRSDPATALAELGARLALTPAPDDVLPTVVVTLRESLRLPFAFVTLVGETRPAAASGEPVGRSVTFPLQYGGRPVGTLNLGLRRGERALSVADQRLVAGFVAQAGAAAHGAQVTHELRRSRERLVLAREEERRIMRRELHDGIGPTLAGMSLGLQSLQRSATNDDQARLAADLLDQAQQSLAEVRILARDLRPAALDELGLVAAVRQHAQTTGRLCAGHPEVDVDADGSLPALPAAVEVAAYRIVQEGITNAVRHADADMCRVRITANGSLIVQIEDDGTGLTPHESGAGIRSMSERAEELGGACTITFTPGRGTTILAVLPLDGPDNAPEPGSNETSA